MDENSRQKTKARATDTLLSLGTPRDEMCSITKDLCFLFSTSSVYLLVLEEKKRSLVIESNLKLAVPDKMSLAIRCLAERSTPITWTVYSQRLFQSSSRMRMLPVSLWGALKT